MEILEERLRGKLRVVLPPFFSTIRLVFDVDCSPRKEKREDIPHGLPFSPLLFKSRQRWLQDF